MSSQVTASWQPAYIALSFAISMIGSFVALTAAMRIRAGDGAISRFNILCAGVALGGIGVWSMHFIGMMALKVDVATSYSLVETGLSLVAAVAAAAAGLGYVARRPERWSRLVTAGVLLGGGVVTMHYLGMFGMKFGGFIAWDTGRVALSAAIAVGAATAALWLAFHVRGLRFRVAASGVMATAICAMHYSGMAAAEYICTTADRNVAPEGFGYLQAGHLPLLVAATALAMAVMIVVDQLFQREIHETRRTKADFAWFSER